MTPGPDHGGTPRPRGTRSRAPRPGVAWGGRRIARLLAFVLSEYGDVCHLCGRAGSTSIDHVIPRSMGGTDDLENLRPSHGSCNSARQAMPLDQWYRKHPIDVEPIVSPSREW